jgi:integrase
MAKREKKGRDGVYTKKGREGFYGYLIDGTGRPVRRKLEGAHTLTQARERLAELKAAALAIREGKPLEMDETFAAFIAETFMPYQRKRISPVVVRGKISQTEFDRQEGIFTLHLLPKFGPMRMSDIRRAHVVQYIHDRTGAVADGTLIKEINVLKRVFSVAIDLEKINANPAAKVPLPQAAPGRTRYLSADEWKKVAAACTLYKNDWSEISALGKLNKKRIAEGKPELVMRNMEPLPPEEQWLRNVVGLCVSMGTRRGELMHCSLSDIDLEMGTIMLRKTKNGKTRTAFINDLAIVVLTSMKIAERQQRNCREPLFPGITPGQVTVAFRRACQRAEVHDFSLHDLRHTYASHMRMKGADLHDLQVLLGHSDPRMTSRYAHLSNEHLSNAAKRLNGVLALN